MELRNSHTKTLICEEKYTCMFTLIGKWDNYAKSFCIVYGAREEILVAQNWQRMTT